VTTELDPPPPPSFLIPKGPTRGGGGGSGLWRSLSQHVAVRCSVLQCVVMCCRLDKVVRRYRSGAVDGGRRAVRGLGCGEVG